MDIIAITNLIDQIFAQNERMDREEDDILEVANSLVIAVINLSPREINELPDQIRDLAITLKRSIDEIEECDGDDEEERGKYCIDCGEYLSQRAKFCSRCGMEQ